MRGPARLSGSFLSLTLVVGTPYRGASLMPGSPSTMLVPLFPGHGTSNRTPHFRVENTRRSYDRRASVSRLFVNMGANLIIFIFCDEGISFVLIFD